MKVKLHHLKGRYGSGYVSFGVPWDKGEVKADTVFSITDDNNAVSEVQTRPAAYWPDGSVKWTAHTAKIDTDSAVLSVSDKPLSEGIATEDLSDKIIVRNGTAEAVFPKSGSALMLWRGMSVSLKAIKEQRRFEGETELISSVPYLGYAEEVTVEECGPLKTVIKTVGTHKNEHGSFLPFIIRFIILKDEPQIKLMHTFFYDGDPSVDFIKGVGIEISRPMCGELYNRRIKIAGDFGMMHEPIQNTYIWHPMVCRFRFIEQQLRGENIKIDTDDADNKAMLDDICTWDSYKLIQQSADSYKVSKRTESESCAYINAAVGSRSKGLMYIGDEDGGAAVGMRDFWQKFPSELEVKGLSKNEAKLCAWIVAPDCPAFDMRHYDTKAHSQAYYEGFDIVGSDPVGISVTNELSLFAFGSYAQNDTLMQLAEEVQKPAVMLCDVSYYHDRKALGEWSMISRDTPLKAWLEDELDKAFDFYKNEIEQRRWYGLFDYGDVMHTYDKYRHCWKYDMGGYAWQNTELMPTMWLWYAFLRSGREDIFTVAEAMSRHSSEVDIYHFGSLKGLGSRHNVIHWGDSCKEPRIAMAGHHRALYFLTGGDYRLRDVFEDVKDADFSTLETDPLRFFYDKSQMKLPTHARSGPDWSTYCSNWFTMWELTGDTKYKDKILTGFKDLEKAPLRMISGSNFEYDPESGHLGYIGESAAGGAHLAVCMGGPQTYFELERSLDYPPLRDMLIQYGKFYFLPPEEKRRRTNNLITGNGFVYPYMAASLCAYAAREAHDEKLAHQVWQVLVHSLAGKNKDEGFDKEIVKNYFNNAELEEMFWISTNFTAQWCLNTIVALELTKDYLENSKEDYEWEDWVK
ncbi:MAG: hypothetical protein PUF72_10210 [Clostridiales bacterium]|nr:hypothetical protein [Clostridiales bacterium]